MRSGLSGDAWSETLRGRLIRIQHELFVAQAELATPSGTPEHHLEQRHIDRLEKEIDEFSADLEPVRSFVLSHGAGGGAQLHLARTVARRAERALWALNRSELIRPELLIWLNRLSDLLFAMALETNRRRGVTEVNPDYTV